MITILIIITIIIIIQIRPSGNKPIFVQEFRGKADERDTENPKSNANKKYEFYTVSFGQRYIITKGELQYLSKAN